MASRGIAMNQQKGKGRMGRGNEMNYTNERRRVKRKRRGRRKSKMQCPNPKNEQTNAPPLAINLGSPR
jgi:hypothetical protein